MEKLNTETLAKLYLADRLIAEAEHCCLWYTAKTKYGPTPKMTFDTAKKIVRTHKILTDELTADFQGA